ncbi:MAG: hypothetical protein ACRC6V_09990 [Bacteroidales bacterium]
MPIMRVRSVGATGVVKDLPAFELPPNAWSHANNVRFMAGRVEKVGGYMPILQDTMPDNQVPLAVVGRNNAQNIIYGTSQYLYLVDGRQHTNVSKLAPKADPKDPDVPFDYKLDPSQTWYYTTLSNAIVMNTPGQVPQGFRSQDGTFLDLPGWGCPNSKQPDRKVDWRAGRIRSFRNYLVALDMTEGGGNMPQRVRWSNVAYVNELPPDWYEDDITRDGGFNDLTDASGRIVDGFPLRDSFVVYTDKETYLMEYVGGVLIFQFKKLFSDSGILAPECAIEFEQKHFVISQDDIFVHNGSSKQPVASGRVKKYLIDEISSVNPRATKVFAYAPQKEIWITYVGPGADDPDNADSKWACNRCAIWNWEFDTWSFMDIPPCYDINMAPPPDLTTPEWEELDGTSADAGGEDWWDSEKWVEEEWNELGKDFLRNIPYAASPDGCLYTLDVGREQVRYTPKGPKDYEIRPVVAELQRYHLDMDEMVENTRLHKMVRHVTPQFRGDGNIHCYVGGSYNPTQEPSWDNYQVFDIEEDVKVDAFSNNRYPAFRFVDLSKGDWSFEGYDIDFVVEGTR